MYDDYMRDFFYYNQNPNMNGFNQMNYMPNNNIENLFPNIYRIIMPVVKRVVAGSNYQFLTEEVLNNMVDTVYNIIDGDRTISKDNENNSSTENRRVSNTNNSNSSSQNQSINTQTSRDDTNNQNELLKDLIRILILQEIIKNGNRRNFNQMNQNYNNSNMYSNQYQPNFYEPISYF